MSEATVTLKPAQEVLIKANEETVITDSKGRSIKMKKPGVLAQYRLIEALGEVSANTTYMAMVMPLIYVVAIDDSPVHQPKSKIQVEALIQQLDEEGIQAVMKHVMEAYGEIDPEADKAALKK